MDVEAEVGGKKSFPAEIKIDDGMISGTIFPPDNGARILVIDATDEGTTFTGSDTTAGPWVPC